MSRSPRPHSPCSRFRFRSALGTTPPQTRVPSPLGAEPLDPSAQPLPPRVPKPLTPGTHPPLGTCWPPWPFPPPPPAAQRGPEGSRGQDSKRSPERGAGASQKSQSGPRSRRLRSLSRRGSSRPALSPPPLSPHARDAETGAGPLGFFRNELGSRRTGGRLQLPPPSPSRTRRWTLRAAAKTCRPASGFASFRNTFGGSAEQGPALGFGRRARPQARLLPEEVRLPPANRGPGLGYFRCGSAPPPGAGRGVGLNSLLAGVLQLRLRPRKT